MGLFDKIKKLSNNLSADKIQGKMNSVNTEDITTKITSVNDSLVDKMESTIEKVEDGAAEDIVTKFSSATDSMADKITSKFEQDDDYDDDDEDDEEYDEEEDEEDYDDEDEEDYEDEDLKARKKERNKKVAKGFAKGAMFVGSFLYAQKEGADSGTSLLHAFSKTKEVDDFFEGKKKEGKNKKEKEQSKDKQIRSIARYQYICPKNNRGHNIDVPDIDIPTTDGSGCPSREEAVEAIMSATGVSKSQAQGIWNGGATNAWRKVSYTYVNDGKRGGTVKC